MIFRVRNIQAAQSLVLADERRDVLPLVTLCRFTPSRLQRVEREGLGVQTVWVRWRCRIRRVVGAGLLERADDFIDHRWIDQRAITRNPDTRVGTG